MNFGDTLCFFNRLVPDDADFTASADDVITRGRIGAQS